MEFQDNAKQAYVLANFDWLGNSATIFYDRHDVS